MRLLPRSLFGRLLATALVAMLAALVFAAFAIGHVLERFVTHGLDERLDAQIAVVARAVAPDGRLDRTRAVDVPPFDRAASGWMWEIRAPGGTLRSASLGQGDIVPEPGPPMRFDAPFGPDDGNRPHPFEAQDAAGRRVHGRMLTIATPQGAVRIVATGPRAVVERPLHAAMTPLLLSLLALGTAMALAILVQLRIGLRPLAGLRAALAEVREGRREHVEAREPAELLPLVAELNALIDANRTSLAQARGHVANLAHGLKTPLAGLRLDLAGRDPDGRLADHVDRIDAQVRHHLARARAASDAGFAAQATALAGHVDDLVVALGRIHAARAIEAEVAVAPDLRVRCDPQDLDEMLGNLLDNAWMWARQLVTIAAAAEGRDIAIRITDDGPGLAPDLIARATEPGWRLDEASPGHGFGLTIARELAELHGGALRLERGVAGGLVATLVLRAAV